ncbi:hypothetical protein PoB_005741300 [Plakobranchus ocellatus]|uniref:Uncharacterized protein n=1 Tax=Plakobranchus ocellatus TaxID=259542 RepID=A0AAV4CG51_9GAST|nr:hypothetical protein PoB_005741300 [Plakobranchus ocellatus]
MRIDDFKKKALRLKYTSRINHRLKAENIKSWLHRLLPGIFKASDDLCPKDLSRPGVKRVCGGKGFVEGKGSVTEGDRAPDCQNASVFGKEMMLYRKQMTDTGSYESWGSVEIILVMIVS